MISVNNLDLGYQQCSDLHKLLNNSGVELMNNLESNISDLKIHWLGSDAKVHINNLIQVYEALANIVSEGIQSTSSAASRITAMQRIRSANGGMGMVGEELSKTTPSVQSIPKVEDTNEYNIDPAITSDYQKFSQIHRDYNSFIERFIETKTALMNNWTEGANRGETERLFNQFQENSDTYEKYISEAEQNLSMAVSNISQIID